MWYVIAPTGLATTVVDFTSELSILGIGLFGLVGLSALMIVWAAMREHKAWSTETAAGPEFAPTEQQEAA